MRLIDADELTFQLKGIHYYLRDSEAAEVAARILVAASPTIDATPVVHGRWKYYHKQNMAVCTNCSFERDLDTNFGKAVSCPNCGALMDLKE
jgi:hypothetical protein